MLSILIPTYNFPCISLVQNLCDQAIGAGIIFEIIVVDDCSLEEWKLENRAIHAISHCKFIELESNIGPARTRNYLAEKAAYPYLLYLDADTMPAGNTFIEKYLTNIQSGSVICGGLKYKRHKPSADSALRYYYGISAEERTVPQREEMPYQRFISMNFLIPKSVFMENKFNETFHLGYEDTFWGKQLEENKVPVIHIDNPVYHEAFESSEQFLWKTRRAVKNLIGHEQELQSHVRLLRMYFSISRWKLDKPALALFRLTEKLIVKNLTGAHPSMTLFAFYKLGYLCRYRTEAL